MLLGVSVVLTEIRKTKNIRPTFPNHDSNDLRSNFYPRIAIQLTTCVPGEEHTFVNKILPSLGSEKSPQRPRWIEGYFEVIKARRHTVSMIGMTPLLCLHRSTILHLIGLCCV
jgi:hypothetical protein